MKTITIILLVFISLKASAQNLDTIITSAERIPCTITFINENNIFYSFIEKRKSKNENIPLVDVERIFLNINSDAYILISDTVLYQNIKNGNKLNIKNTKEQNEIDSTIYKPENKKKVKTQNIQNDIKMDLLINDINNIKQNLEKCHKQYKLGTNFIIGGLSATFVGSYFIFESIDNSNSNSNYGSIGTILTLLGGISTIVGCAIQIDSHKYISRASISAGVNGATLKINF